MSSLSCLSGTKLSQHTHTSSPTGTKLSQHAQKGPFQPVLAEQGELYTATVTNKPSRENFVPHPAPPAVQNSPNNCPLLAKPVQNSPSTPQKAHFHAFWPSRENFLPLSPTPSPARRTLYRTHSQSRYKTPPTTALYWPNRYKTLPTHPKLPISARFARAGRTFYRHRHQ